MKTRWWFIPAFLLVLAWPKGVCGAPQPGPLFLKTDFKVWDVNLQYLDLLADYEKTTFKGIPVSISEEKMPLVEGYVERALVKGVDVLKVRDYLAHKYAPAIHREKEDVKIDLDVDGKPVFLGYGLYGRELDLDKGAFTLKKAIEENIRYVNLPVIKKYPQVTVDKKLADKGIVELVASGETDFSGSPPNRINNIKVGIARFNGHLVPPEEEFVFGEILGPVDETTGYKKELVIKGDRTVPEYGGGLCQVSTTAYRAILNGGFPVTRRRNHTFAVRYYEPIGLDATVYPPTIDLKFMNDSPAHLLMQAFAVDNKAYYNFYGTSDHRQVHLLGPFYYGQTPPPPARMEYTSKLSPGEKEILGKAVPGLGSSWYREVLYSDPKKPVYFESIHSKYQARPDFVAIGVTPGQETPEGKSLIETTF